MSNKPHINLADLDQPLPAVSYNPESYDLPHATAPRDVPTDAVIGDPTLLFNRELGDIDFNWRVLYQAMDVRVPLLERVFYLSICYSNLDEFFQKRVGGLKRQNAAGVSVLSADGRNAEGQLELIIAATHQLYERMQALWTETLKPALQGTDAVHVLNYSDLDTEQRQRLAKYFRDNLYPIITPLAVDIGRPFPFISSMSTSLAVTLKGKKGETLFVRIKIPSISGRWLEVEKKVDEALQVIALEELIEHHIADFFPGMTVTSVSAFRVTRNADFRLDEEEAEDLIEAISEELRGRRFAPVVRLEVEETMPKQVREYLRKHLKLERDDVFEATGLLGLNDISKLTSVPRPDLRFEPFEAMTAPRLQEHFASEQSNFFDVIKRGDILLHHPYELFSNSVQRFLDEAANDPNVLAIKMTLYRTSSNSPIIAALLRAAEYGKQVAVLVEVKARFDEQNNIEWGEKLEAAGVHVSYGFVDLKIHTKIALVVRQEGERICTYCHVGTGNYNAKTARLYTDLGIFTGDATIGNDLINLFHHITGYAPNQHYQKMLIAPWILRDSLLEHIEREIEIQKQGGRGRIIAKMNGLDDIPMIEKLYEASRAGVEIDLIVRGHSRLRPGVVGFSENIRVFSIIGRFLEHDRIFYFRNNEDEKFFIGSADWKNRNLSGRIEAVAPVEDSRLRERLAEILQACLDDNRLAWDLQPNGQYLQRMPADGEAARGLQQVMMQRIETLRSS